MKAARRDTRGSTRPPATTGRPACSSRRLAGPLLLSLLLSLIFLAPSVSAAENGSFQFVKAFGPDGTSASGFSAARSVAIDQGLGFVYVLDPGAGALFKFDLEGSPVDFGGLSSNVDGNKLTGFASNPDLGKSQVAVDPKSHTIYVTGKLEGAPDGFVVNHALQAFQANGEPALFTAGLGAETNELPALGVAGVAVDGQGNIYLNLWSGEATVEGSHFTIYDPTGSLLASASASSGDPKQIAVDSSNGGLHWLPTGSLERLEPSEYPVGPATEYTQQWGTAFDQPVAVSVDSGTHEAYVAWAFTANERVEVFDIAGNSMTSFGGNGEAGELERPAGVAVDNGEERAYVSTNPEGGLSQVEIFQREWCVCAPTVERTFATQVSADSAKLTAKITPNERPTTYWFEYGLGDCGQGSCTKVLLQAAPVGSGHKPVSVSQNLVGLQPGTPYHYRVVAKNDIDTTNGPDRTFTTQSTGAPFELSDSRVWELVSPPNKLNGSIYFDIYTAVQASATGDSLAYASRGAIVKEVTSSKSPIPASVLGKRGGDGTWASTDLSVPHTVATQGHAGTEYRLFTSDLTRAVLEPVDGTPLSPFASEATPYLWSDVSAPRFTPLVTPANVTPTGLDFEPNPQGGSHIRMEGASSDLSYVVLQSRDVPLLEGTPATSIYGWADGELETISELPEAEGGTPVEGMLGSGPRTVRNAISSDGSRVFWSRGSYATENATAEGLYLRDTVAGASVRLDVVQPGGSGEGKVSPSYQVASPDGSVVLFTDFRQLTADSSPGGRDLYRCEIGPVEGGLGCAELTDLSVPVEAGESAQLLGVSPAASADASRLYFVARGRLDEAPNDQGDVAVAGEPNLYLWQEGRGIEFIATLSQGDERVWGPRRGNAPEEAGSGPSDQVISAVASPSGRFFAFTSERSLTGEENLDPAGKPVTNVFMFDAEAPADHLTCVSCNVSGAAPIGVQVNTNFVAFPPDRQHLWEQRRVAATLPEATSSEVGRSLYRPRAVSGDGRLFFNSVEALVPADSNGNWDVYQYEPFGVGSCSRGSDDAAVVTSATGCIGLISSGAAEGPSAFLDASASGNDVFFVTRGRLSALDQDGEVDVYDARVNGVAAQLPSRPECLGEACQAPAGAPTDPTPGSASFQGPGNPKHRAAKRCPKGTRKVRRHGRARCLARKHRHKAPRHKSSQGTHNDRREDR